MCIVFDWCSAPTPRMQPLVQTNTRLRPDRIRKGQSSQDNPRLRIGGYHGEVEQESELFAGGGSDTRGPEIHAFSAK